MDQIIASAKLEEQFIFLAVRDRGLDPALFTSGRLARFAKFSALALRVNVARNLLGLSFRDFSMRAADSPLLQWFLQASEIDKIRTPSKSTVDRFSRWVKDASLRQIINELTTLAAAPAPEGQCAALQLEAPIQSEEAFFDATCAKLNIHFPIDWILLRDATRTLMKAVVCIRKAGLKQRMPQEPLAFLSAMNTLCMKMSAQRRKAQSAKGRKAVLRQMKKLQRTIAAHARSHREALATRREESSLSQGQARVILERIDNVLEQLPAAIKQAHERIIGGRQVPNAQKILSLYDENVQVIVRGKAGAEVEFGNKLWIGESRQGLVLDYQLLSDNPADTALLKPALQRCLEDLKLPLKTVWGDRGLFSKANVAALEARGIKSGLCPRDPAELARKLQEDPAFAPGLKRRGGVEARIGIFKNVFLGRIMRGKSLEHRKQAVGWAVLAHNLWVLARLPYVKPAVLTNEQAGVAQLRARPQPEKAAA